MLRFEAVVHNTAELRCGRMIEHFPEIVSQLAGIAERFCTALDCVDTGFIADGVLDELPTGSTLGATRVGGVDLNKQRMRDALSAVLALAPAPRGFTVGELAAKVHAMTGRSAAAYTIRQAAYDLRKLRSKQLVDETVLATADFRGIQPRCRQKSGIIMLPGMRRRQHQRGTPVGWLQQPVRSGMVGHGPVY